MSDENQNQASPHPATKSLLGFFTYGHLPPNLQEVSSKFGMLAEFMAYELPASAETTAGLRKLLEAKDCAVRAALSKS